MRFLEKASCKIIRLITKRLKHRFDHLSGIILLADVSVMGTALSVAVVQGSFCSAVQDLVSALTTQVALPTVSNASVQSWALL